MPDQMIRPAGTDSERADMQTYLRLAKIEKAYGKLSEAQAKQLIRVRNRLLMARVIKPVPVASLRTIARHNYAMLPWWRKTSLRFRYHVMQTWLQLVVFWHQLKER